MKVYRREGERKECPTEAEAEQRRPGGDYDFEYADAETGLAEYCDHFQSPHEDPAGSQRDGGTSA